MHNDDGTMKQTNVSKIYEYVFSKVSGDASIASGGTLTIGAGAVEGSMLNNNVISGQTSALASGLADTDEFLVSDAGTIKRMDASVLKEYVSSLSITLADDTDDLEPGFNYLADLGGAEAVNLPASPNPGDVVYVKAPSNCSTTNKLTINRQGSHTIDGETSIILESAHAAVSIVYVAVNTWKIF